MHPMEGELTMVIAISPTGTLDGSYYFLVDANGILNCYMGTRINNSNVDTDVSSYFITIRQKEQKQLSSIELQHLFGCADELDKTDNSYEFKVVRDGWHYAVLYNGKIYEMDSGDNETALLQKIISEIIGISPLPVDSRAWGWMDHNKGGKR